MKNPPRPVPRNPQHSTPAAGLELEARRRQRLRTVELLKTNRTPLDVIAVAESGARVAAAATEESLRRQPPRRPSACREGCAWCCHKLVGTSQPEVFRIARFLRETFPVDACAATVARIEKVKQERERLRADGWAAKRLPCALLVDGRCSVYPVRPLTCRGFNSSDAAACERSVVSRERGKVPIFEPQLRIATFVLDGTRAGLAELGMNSDLLELNAALGIALSLADAEERWLRGEPVFATARLE
jgi:Fe-S-cluster containining protein